MKETLETLGWKCSRCSCPGLVGWDCAHSDHRGFIIQVRDKRFKIVKNSRIIESGWGYELKGKMAANELI